MYVRVNSDNIIQEFLGDELLKKHKSIPNWQIVELADLRDHELGEEIEHRNGRELTFPSWMTSPNNQQFHKCFEPYG